MGKAKEIVKLDLGELIEDLNRAYADEWLAFYQYWIAAQVVTGMQAPRVAGELKSIAMEELEHAEELAVRIAQLGGTPLTNPKEWFEKTNCGYAEPPKDPSDVEAIVKMVVEAEGCAIEVYDRLAEKTHGKDWATHHLMRHILDEELEHEMAFETLLGK